MSENTFNFTMANDSRHSNDSATKLLVVCLEQAWTTIIEQLQEPALSALNHRVISFHLPLGPLEQLLLRAPRWRAARSAFVKVLDIPAQWKLGVETSIAV